MGWTEQETATRTSTMVDAEKAKLLDKVRGEVLPVVQKEADGVRPFDTIELQPVKGPNAFEAEFGLKGDDVLFHFWPWGYHDADRKGVQPPRFRKDFESLLKGVMGEVFGIGRVELSFDDDMGAWFVLAKGFALNQFHRELCIKAAESLFKAMGGS